MKNVNDYIPKLQEMFTKVKKQDIERMVKYGWRMFYFYNLRGCDTLIESQKHKFWMYCGKMFCDSKHHYNYYKKHLRRKLRVMFIKKKKQWDGYYYTALNEEEYNQLIIKKGRPRKYYKYNNKISFKIFGEAKLYYSSEKCIIKFKYVSDMGWDFYKDEIKISNPEIVLVRNSPDTFKDIMIQNNKYDIL